MKCPKCSEELENSSGGWICQFCGYDDKQSRIEELEGNCDDRNHVGLEKVINKMGLGQEIFPDSELGQNVAFLAMVIQDMMNKNKELEARLSTALTALREIDEYLLDVEIQIDDHRNLLPHVHELIKAALDKVEGK